MGIVVHKTIEKLLCPHIGSTVEDFYRGCGPNTRNRIISETWNECLGRIVGEIIPSNKPSAVKKYVRNAIQLLASQFRTYTIESVERTINGRDTKNREVIGIIDLILISSDRNHEVIIDWKTTNSIQHLQKSKFQLAVYTLLKRHSAEINDLECYVAYISTTVNRLIPGPNDVFVSHVEETIEKDLDYWTHLLSDGPSSRT